MRRDARRLFGCSRAALAAVEQENTCCTVKKLAFFFVVAPYCCNFVSSKFIGAIANLKC